MNDFDNQPAQKPGFESQDRRVLKLHPGDTVAVALTALEAGSTVRLEDGELVIREDIPVAHKVARVRHGLVVVRAWPTRS